MTPGVVLRQEQQNLEKQMERQMGCMAGFFQMFDRHQILAGKRIYSTKRLPSSPGTSSPSPSERSDVSPPSFSKDSFTSLPTPLAKLSPKPNPPTTTMAATADTTARTSTTPLPLPVFEFKDGAKTSWKLREAPRLSLDSRLRDNKGKLFPPEIRTTPVPIDAGDDQDRQRRSPSVVARLMGLDLFPQNGTDGVKGDGPIASGFTKLPRSASESRATKEFLQYPLFQQEKIENYSQDRGNIEFSKPKFVSAVSQPKAAVGYSNTQTKKKSSFNAQDFYPEPSRRIVPAIGGSGGSVNGNLYWEIEKRHRMRGVDEPSMDFETLKQILEALQLKGLLHSSPSPLYNHQINCRTLVVDQQTSPIVLMKPSNAAKSSSPLQPSRKTNNADSRERSGNRRGSAPRRLSPDAINPTSPARRKLGNSDRRMSSPAQSPRSVVSPRKSTPPSDKTNKSPRTSKPLIATERFSDESSTISDGSYGVSSSHFHIEKVKVEEYREGRNLLERCDKLLHSIAEITSSTATVAQQQPSPISVLNVGDSFRSDAGGDLESPCSSNLKRRIKFGGDVAEEREEEGEDDGGEERWRPAVVVPTLLLPLNDAEAGDRDFTYVAEIFRSVVGRSSSSPSAIPLDVYSSLEKLYLEEDHSKASRMHRRLVFETVVEIANNNRHVSPWESFSRSRSVADWDASRAPARETWAELKRIREPILADDLCELVCGVLRKDLTGYGGCVSRETKGWSDRSFEMSDAVLDVERLIFKDLVAETIKGLTSFSSSVQKSRPSSAVSRRKLLF